MRRPFTIGRPATPIAFKRIAEGRKLSPDASRRSRRAACGSARTLERRLIDAIDGSTRRSRTYAEVAGAFGGYEKIRLREFRRSRGLLERVRQLGARGIARARLPDWRGAQVHATTRAWSGSRTDRVRRRRRDLTQPFPRSRACGPPRSRRRARGKRDAQNAVPRCGRDVAQHEPVITSRAGTRERRIHHRELGDRS